LPNYPAPTDDNEGYASFNGPGQLAASEYPAYGDGLSYIEPCLKLTFADGTRTAELEFVTSTVQDDSLTLTLRDAHYPVRLALHYHLHAHDDLLERWVTIYNEGDTAVTIERIFSAQWHVPTGHDYHLRHLVGRWYDEWQLVEEPLTAGTKTLESRRLTTSHHHNPWFTLHRPDQPAAVWFGTLAWSGNWKLTAEVSETKQTRLSLGLNDWDFAWQLGAGETFTTPFALAGYTAEGFAGARRCLHQHIRRHLPHPEQLRPVLYNSWEATMFAVDEPSQKQLAERAAELGVELFVMDDGWFHGRVFDNAGLGDWWPDETKFPHGLQPLIQHVNQLGMQFGLWLEPEMVNPDSELYRAHPDWVIHFPTRPRTPARNQLILNLARPDVQTYLIEKLDALLSQHNIAFIKWDMNRNVSEPGWPNAPADPREIWVRYVQGLYRVWDTLRERHPQVLWQSCSGGGGRADLGILHRADQIWVSDNTNPARRLAMQYGFSQCFPAGTMEAWVTKDEFQTLMGQGDPVHYPLQFRFHVSMMGVLGLGMNLHHLSDAEKAEAQKLIATYKEIRPLVQQGEQFWLVQTETDTAVLYLDESHTEGVLFAFRTFLPEPSAPLRLRLAGLTDTAVYKLEGIGQKTGAEWQATDLALPLGNFESRLLRLTQQPDPLKS
ncbi:MAG: alpha-galactosidase, partial [Anaerolineales bacterium]|nr:alpha-galactosidase [Anaerolineales bacterium]